MKISMTPLVTATLLASASASSLRSEKQNQRGLAVVIPSDHLVSKTKKVKYQCTVSSSWSSENHPVDYPSDAHTSPPVLVAHNANYKMFTPGQAVSPGVKMVAETGNPSTLIEELDGAGADVMSWVVGVPMFFEPQPEAPADGDMMMPADGDMMMPAPDIAPASAGGGRRQLAEGATKVSKGGDPIVARAQQISDMLVFTPEHNKFTSITMLAPSPDWFSSSHGTSPITDSDEGEVWLKSFKYETLPYDAGTDSGVTFTSEDIATDPVAGSEQFAIGTPLTENGIFVNAAGDGVNPVMGWECSIAEVLYECEFDPECTTSESNEAESAAPIVRGALAVAAMVGTYLFL